VRRVRGHRPRSLLPGALALAALIAIPARAEAAPGPEGADPGAAAARAPAAVCARACPGCEPGDGAGLDLACAAQSLACRSEETLCEAKLAVYHAHMEELAAGVELAVLPATYRRVLGRFFPRLALAAVRFGWSDRQPPDNAITDCDRIYFARSDFVERLRRGELRVATDWLWLLHELRHAEQCAALGGRDAYAARWLDELGLAFLADADLATLHDRIPLEDDADERAKRVFAELSRCCLVADGGIDPNGGDVASPPPAGAARSPGSR
jgi:hypothetical protein